MKKKIKLILEDKKLCARIVDNAFFKAEKEFNWNNVSGRILKVYGKVLE
ncbi:MAG: hypothetical protein ABH986_03570 [archaeon]